MRLPSRLPGIVVAILLAAPPVLAQPAPEPEAPPEETPPDAEPSGEPDASEAAEAEKLAEAKRLFHAANELRKAGAFGPALKLYMQSRALVVSVQNTLNAAVCLDELGRYDEALELYELLLSDFADKLRDDERASLVREVGKLRKRVGNVNVQANVEGKVVIDGRPRGTLPMVTDIRVLPGEHVVRVFKDGHRTFEQTIDVPVEQTIQVNAKLEPLAVAGTVKIDDEALVGAEVLIDGAPLGTVPWSGTLEPGEHYFALRKGDDGTAPQSFVVVKGQTALLSGELLPLGPEIRVNTVPPSAELRIGDVLVGTGRWSGRLPIGKHTLESRSEGYFDREQTLVIDDQTPGEVTLQLEVDESHARWGVAESGAFLIDVFGAFSLAPSLGSGAEDDASAGGAAEVTDNPAALGFMVGARGAYELPFGLGIEVGGGYFSVSKTVQRTVRSSYPGSSGDVPLQYELEDTLRVSGPFAGAGLSYRLPFADVFEVRPHVLVGALFSFARDTVTGSASANGDSVPVTVTNSGDSAAKANLFVMPSADLGVRFGGFGVGIQMAAMIVALEGPQQKNDDMAVDPGSGPLCGTPDHVTCVARTRLVAEERAYGTFVTLMPGITAGYAF